MLLADVDSFFRVQSRHKDDLVIALEHVEAEEDSRSFPTAHLDAI